MKKFFSILFLLLIFSGGIFIYETIFKSKIPMLDIENESINIDKLYVYGTHLNLHGDLIDADDLKLVLYNGKFKEVNINKVEDAFNLSNFINDGLCLETLSRGKYFLFLRGKEIDNDGNFKYKYYPLNNTTDYKETIYYTFNNIGNKITIGSEDSYPTMIINVEKNNDDGIYDIVIDPGHGGMDSGAVHNGYKESSFTMDIASQVKKRLESKGLKVKLTRENGELEKDELINEYGKHGRAVIPYEVKAKYVFSIHINSNNNNLVHGLEVYTPKNINYDFASYLVNNIVESTGIDYSNNKSYKIFNGIYSRNFTVKEIEISKKDMQKKGRKGYDITTNANYFYMIRETGGIVTGAYVDGRNEEIIGNPYVKSNIGAETYLLELGFITNKNDLNNLINHSDKYAKGISNSIYYLYEKMSKV